MKLAVIDLGTNTFHLLLAKTERSGFRVLSNIKIPVRIGQGGISQNTITPEARERAMAALKSFRSSIDLEGIDHITATATSAFRNAKNGEEFLATIYQQTGIAINIISGTEEAELIYHGVNLALSLDMDNALIMDIGGGSVEFIIANGQEIFWKESFEIGAQRLMDQFHKTDPITASEILELGQHLNSKLETLRQEAKRFEPLTLVGSSGTFDTLIDIDHMAKDQAKQYDATQFELDIDDFLSIYNQIIAKNRSERTIIPGMIEMRVDMIVVACCLIHYVIDHITVRNPIRISSYALKEGVLAAQMKKFTE